MHPDSARLLYKAFITERLEYTQVQLPSRNAMRGAGWAERSMRLLSAAVMRACRVPAFASRRPICARRTAA